MYEVEIIPEMIQKSAFFSRQSTENRFEQGGGCMVYLVFLFFLFSGCAKQQQGAPLQVARLNMQAEPISLDPRKARDLDSGAIVRMLFEGLMRVSHEGKLEPAVAERIEISEDRTLYTVFLRQTKWSNGDLLTADDFVSSWKTILDPQFVSDTAYHLYPILGAKKAKQGLLSLDEVGLKVFDTYTFSIQLEQPTPYFLDLLTMPPFFPVHRQIAASHPRWSLDPALLVSNGPFQMSEWTHADRILLKKNQMYWEQKETRLDGVELIIASADTALRCFEAKDLDWMGSPLSTLPIDAIPSLKKEKALQTAPFLATSFCRCNTRETIGDQPNLLSLKSFRKALSVCLDRTSLIEHVLKGGQKRATSLVPEEMGLQRGGYFQDHDQEGAKRFLQEALREAGDSPLSVKLRYFNNERNTLIAQWLQQEWEQKLGLRIEMEAVESKIFFQRISKGDFQIAIGSWTADFNDPINFLEVFKYKDNGTNNTGWEKTEYIDLLTKSQLCTDVSEREALLRKAEGLLMEEMPILPLYQFVLNYVKSDALTGVFLSPEGYLDLRKASIH